VRPGPWLLLSFLLSTSAVARNGAGAPALQRRTLVLPSRPGQVPPLELHVATGVATLVHFDSPPSPEALDLLPDDGRLQLARMDDGSLILVLTRNLAPGEQVLLSVSTRANSEPLRFALVTRHDAVDLQVRVVCAPDSAREQDAELVARSLLDAPDSRGTLAVPQVTVDLDLRSSFGQVESVLWLGRRFFATVAVRSRKEGVPPWALVQARLRATLAEGELLEWPVHLLSGRASTIRQRHVLTGLLPEGASRLELALDGEDAPGDFCPLPLDEEPAHP
jgi:hypothetical protein